MVFEWLARVLAGVEAVQQLQLQECLSAVAQAGLGEQAGGQCTYLLVCVEAGCSGSMLRVLLW